jgi:membrane-associated phospholipid phosphatase
MKQFLRTANKIHLQFLIVLLSIADLNAQTSIPKSDTTQVEISSANKFFKTISVPTLLIGAGTYLTLNNNIRYEIRDERNKRYPNFQTSIDDVLFAVPAVAVYGLNFSGIKGKHDLMNSSLLLVKSQLLTLTLTFPLKELTDVTRPDESDNKSFPSGHTSHAFAAATFMAKEFKDKSIWYGVGAYTLATSVGVLRILNNRHWVSDVVAGGGLGLLASPIVFLTHNH